MSEVEEDPDSKLLEEYLSEASQPAFAELVARHSGWVYSAALRLVRDRAVAEDVTQAVFLALAQNGRKLGDRSIAGWLFKTTRYISSTAIRAKSRREKHERQAAMLNVEASRGVATHDSNTAIWEEIALRLEELVARLRASEREAVLLRFYQSKSLAEVGRVAGISEEAARKRVTRALDKLRRLLARSGASIPAEALEALAVLHVAHSAPAGLTASCATLSVSSTANSLAQGVPAMIFKTKMKAVSIGVFVAALPLAFGAMLLAQAVDTPTDTAGAMSAAGAAVAPAENQLMESWWTDLAESDPQSDRALLCFAATPDKTVAFMKTRLLPLTITADRVNELIVALGSDKEEFWKPADVELRYFDPRLAINLQTLMKQVTTTPARQRLTAVLSDRPPEMITSAMKITLRKTGEGFNFFNGQGSWWAEDQVARLNTSPWGNPKKFWTRAIRAIVILQQIGTPDAMAILKNMAGGNPDAQPTKVAQEATGGR